MTRGSLDRDDKASCDFDERFCNATTPGIIKKNMGKTSTHIFGDSFTKNAVYLLRPADLSKSINETKKRCFNPITPILNSSQYLLKLTQ